MFSRLFLFSLVAGYVTADVQATDASETDAHFPNVWQPRLGSKIQMVLTGEVVVSPDYPVVVPVDIPIYDVDLFYTSDDTIQGLHMLGKKVICYFSAGSAEDWRPDYGNFTATDLGNPLGDWPGERYINISSPTVWDIMKARIDLAKEKGCDAIDPDNLGVYILVKFCNHLPQNRVQINIV
jgi:hypothetical protein